MKNTNKDFSARSGFGRGIDVLARATRQAVVRTVRTTTKKGNLSMAKTLRSRIAAVAVVALGAGVLTATAANAAAGDPTASAPLTITKPGSDYWSDTSALANNSTLTVEQEAGSSNYVELKVDYSNTKSTDDTNFKVIKLDGGNFSWGKFASGSGPASVPLFNASAADATQWGFNGSSFANSTEAYLPEANTDGDLLRIATPAVGTITVSYFNRTVDGGTATNATATQKITIKVVKVFSGRTYASATIEDTANASSDVEVGARAAYKLVNPLIDTDVLGRYASAVASTQARFSYTVNQLSATGGPIIDEYNVAVVATLTGPGVLHKTSGTTAGNVYDAPILTFPKETAGNGSVAFDLLADGRAGVSTIEIKVNGVVAKTYTVNFYGAVASYDVKVNHAYIQTSDPTADTLVVTAKDANGIKVPNATVYAKSSDTDVATVESSKNTGDTVTTFGVAKLSMTGKALGTVTVTLANASSSATVTKTATVNVTGKVIKTLTWAFDKATYAPGEKATITFTAKDADGKPVADRGYVIFDGLPTTNVALGGTSDPFDSEITTVSGVATLTVYMPGTVGEVKVSATLVGTSILDAALRGADTSISAKVINADLDTVKAQVAALTTTITAIQTAIATLVASTSATLTVLTNKINKIMKKLKIK